MKKIILIFVFCLFLPVAGWTGENVILPYWINFPDTDAAERVQITLDYGSPNTATVVYSVWNSTRTEVIEQRSVLIEGADFTSFCSGVCATLSSRADAIANTDIQDRYATTPK